MEEEIIDKLVKGEKVKCEFCGAGFWVPFNTTYDKAHCFILCTLLSQKQME